MSSHGYDAGASILAAGLSYYGGIQANQASAAQARANRRWQRVENTRAMNYGTRSATIKHGRDIASAQQAQTFSERMRNTSHQAEVRDLRLAGLNPILSAQRGATSPSGVPVSSAAPSGHSSSGSKAEQRDVITPAVNSALATYRLSQDAKAIQQTTKRTEEETRLAKEKTELEKQRVRLEKIKVKDADERNILLTPAEIIGTRLDNKTKEERIRLLKQTFKLTATQILILQQKIPEVLFQKHISETTWGRLAQWFKTINPFMPSTSINIPVKSELR